MNTEHTSTTKRSLVRLARPISIALAAAMSLAPATAFLDVAHAQDGGDEDQQLTPPISLIDTDRMTTLTINKIEGDPKAEPAHRSVPMPITPSPQGVPMPDITFDVYQLNGLNPANAADWETYAGLDSKTMVAGEGMVLADTVTTDANGSATTQELPVGFYFVREQASAGVIPAPPFLISLPMTDQFNGTEWDYNPSVYPKNQRVELIKTVSDQDIIEGEELTYNLRAGVPALATAGGSFDRFIITDDFDEDHVTITDTSHQVNLVVPNDAGDGSDVFETLTRGTDYTINNDGTTVTMTLTSAGLQKLGEARGGDVNTDWSGQPVGPSDRFPGQPDLKVEWIFDAEITDFNADGAGLILNDATLEPPRAPGVDVDQIPSNKVTTEMIKINLLKVDGETDDVLIGAEFDLYRCAPGTNDLLDDRVLDSAATNSSGTLSFKSVQIPDFANGAERDAAWGYCVVETESPVGFELIPEPVMVNLAGLDAGTNTITVNIENWKENGGNPLPVTGESALLWLAGGAGVLVLGGVAYVIRRRNDVASA